MLGGRAARNRAASGGRRLRRSLALVGPLLRCLPSPSAKTVTAPLLRWRQTAWLARWLAAFRGPTPPAHANAGQPVRQGGKKKKALAGMAASGLLPAFRRLYAKAAAETDAWADLQARLVAQVSSAVNVLQRLPVIRPTPLPEPRRPSRPVFFICLFSRTQRRRQQQPSLTDPPPPPCQPRRRRWRTQPPMARWRAWRACRSGCTSSSCAPWRRCSGVCSPRCEPPPALLLFLLSFSFSFFLQHLFIFLHPPSALPLHPKSLSQHAA